MDTQSIDFSSTIAAELGIRPGQVRTVIQLLSDGNTIPFIARYRKEMTGELDENQLRDIESRHQFHVSLHQRKADVLRLLEEQGVFADSAIATKLTAAVDAAKTLTELDDLYRPYRPKRKTRASVARERGLEPLLRWLQGRGQWSLPEREVLAYVERFVASLPDNLSPQEALQGAIDIFAEEVADHPDTRQWVRAKTRERGLLSSRAVDPEADSVYAPYYAFEERISTAQPHRVLAMNRGERESFLRVSVTAPVEDILPYLRRHHLHGGVAAEGDASYVGMLLDGGIADAYKRLIAPSIERDVRSALTDEAETHAIRIFGENLNQLLMQAPIAGRCVLGVDPAYRTGCKLAVVDPTGKMLEVSVIYPTPPQNKVAEASDVVWRLLAQYQVNLVAIGNGTASRETEEFVADCLQAYRQKTGVEVPYLIVSEAGASVYSASVLAGEEFPDLDVSQRSAISIARRVQDPLAELVKIDPKSVGVGQYQHDVSQQKLSEKLATVVESAVNRVGVDVNTASPSLLSYVSGLNRTVAKNIVEYRDRNGRFRSREALSAVPRLGQKTLTQCVGFLRILDGDEMLDSTPIHPESYGAVYHLLARTGADQKVLVRTDSRQQWLADVRSHNMRELVQDTGVGEPTLRDILDALLRPGRDPREDVPPPLMRTAVLRLEDLAVGTVLTGVVRNVVDFGAFVDVGLKNDGLVHISQLSHRFVKHPLDVVATGDIVTVRVLEVDAQKQRLSLSMKEV